MVRRASLAPAAALLIEIAFAIPATNAFAAWPHDPNNGNVALCTATNSQYLPAIVTDGAGGAIVTWYDYRTGNSDIYVQRVNAVGVPQWSANGVAICAAVGPQTAPVITADGAGGAIIAWYDARSGTYDIYAQRVNAAGVPQWTADGVALSAATNSQNTVTIASDGAGGAIAVWQDYRSGTNYDIYAQRVNAAGSPQWTADGVAICVAANNQAYPTIASDGAGGAIAAWQDYRSGTNWDIYAQRVNASGVAQWTSDGVALCTAASDQQGPVIAADGSGGAVVTWYDYRSGSSNDIYAQRVSAAGSPLWTTNGVALCTAANGQDAPAIASDGAGGAIVTWEDYRSGLSYDIYAQRVSASGAPLWAVNGVALCAAANAQYSPTIASDGAGGAIVSWYDSRTGTNFDVYAQRVSAAGSPLWTTDGAAVSNAVSDQVYPTIAPDGSGGAIITWYDYRSGVADIYAQRIERYGYLGNPEPSILGVKDVPNDQGGFVKVGWSASYLDVDPIAGIYEYRIWRSAPPGMAATRAVLARGVTADPDEAMRTGQLLSLPESATGYLWELVDREPAFELPGYSVVTATTGDSVGAGNPRTAFMIEAGTSAYTYSPHWFSAPDSGYSVDNLPPVVPAPFTGAYSAGATHLHWGENSDLDLAGYRLYRGASSGFTPGPGNLVSAQPDTGYADVGAAGSWYKLSAIDIHGNESLYAILGPNGTLDVPGALATALYFAPPSPNPAGREGTMLRFGLPMETQVTLTLFDQQGRRVRELAHGTWPAGAHAIRWDGRDDAGREVASGIYFARLETQGRSLRVRFASLR